MTEINEIGEKALKLSNKKAIDMSGKQLGIDSIEFTLDGVECFLLPDTVLHVLTLNYRNVACFYNRNGKLVLTVKLPLFIRENNVAPFSVLDMIHIDELRKAVIDGMASHDVDYHKARVSSIEVNATTKCVGESKPADIIRFIKIMTLDTNSSSISYSRANKRKQFVEKLDSFSKSSKHYYTLKVYDKTQQQIDMGNMCESGLIRIELVMVDRTLAALYKDNINIVDILTKGALHKAITKYCEIMLYGIVEGKIKPNLYIIDDILYKDMMDRKSIKEAILANKEIIFDVEMLKHATRKYFNSNKMSDNTCKVIKKYSNGYGFPVDTINTIRKICKICRCVGA